ncbi:uncharacterized protein B0T23DRAFT_420840 [Neurospora hispaniola]|uniref:Uncharacterized protein n=1 Tax=Neurospora hispaniola TaxID=588809 RepID=A0AAJ0I598_9PEZI|nr:hypothetical protein B0T23DRAFT_420840 [Neurospora hispaniola]
MYTSMNLALTWWCNYSPLKSSLARYLGGKALICNHQTTISMLDVEDENQRIPPYRCGHLPLPIPHSTVNPFVILVSQYPTKQPAARPGDTVIFTAALPLGSVGCKKGNLGSGREMGLDERLFRSSTQWASVTPRAGTHHGDAGQKLPCSPGFRAWSARVTVTSQHPEPPSGNTIWAREYPTTTNIKVSFKLFHNLHTLSAPHYS